MELIFQHIKDPVLAILLIVILGQFVVIKMLVNLLNKKEDIFAELSKRIERNGETTAAVAGDLKLLIDRATRR